MVGVKKYNPLARTEVARLQRELDDLVTRCEGLPAGADIESDAYRFAYVRLCGLLEQSLLAAGRSAVRRSTFGEARDFGMSFLARSNRNPTDDQIMTFVARFKEDWANDLRDWLDTDDRGARINSLVGIRNGIAHGASMGGSRTWFDSYYVVVYELIEWLLDRFEPAPV